LQRIEAERAARRMRLGKKPNPTQSFGEGGETDEHVAKALGMSSEQWRKIKTIFAKAQQGDESAQELVKALDAGDISVHKAYQTVKGQLDSEKGEKSRITKALEEAKKNLDEALQNPLTVFGESGLSFNNKPDPRTTPQRWGVLFWLPKIRGRGGRGVSQTTHPYFW